MNAQFLIVLIDVKDIYYAGTGGRMKLESTDAGLMNPKSNTCICGTGGTSRIETSIKIDNVIQ